MEAFFSHEKNFGSNQFKGLFNSSKILWTSTYNSTFKAVTLPLHFLFRDQMAATASHKVVNKERDKQ
jgi:hypothetical protein